MDTMESVALGIIVVVLIVVFFMLIKTPIRLIFKLIINTVGGFITLIIVNFLGSFIGISIGVNWLNAIIVAIFGMPGLGLILILKWLMVI